MDDLHDAVAQILRGHGQRYTPARRAVVEALERANRPVTLPEILADNDDLAQSSAYRNLAEFVDAGVVRRIITSDEYSHFEITDQLTGEHHHHLICTVCGVVEDFTVPNELEDLIDRASRVVARDQQWAVENHRLDLVGQCAGCASN